MEEIEQLRALVREAHEATKDIRAALKEAKQYIAGLKAESDAEYDRIVREGLEEYHNALGKAIESATDAVYRRFDILAGILMGEDPKSRREGKPSLEELFERYLEEKR